MCVPLRGAAHANWSRVQKGDKRRRNERRRRVRTTRLPETDVREVNTSAL